MKKMLFLIILLTEYSCQIDRDKKANIEDFNFKTGDDTEIFFKNMRQSYYHLEENKAAKFNVFRHEDRVTEADYPLLNLAIVINYMQDEAYLLLEPNDVLQDEEQMKVFWSGELNTSGEITLENYNRQEILEFTSRIYEALKKKADLYIEIEKNKVPVLKNENERETFRITVSDFYRLTRIY